jgi:long-chain acyl-CoA synthetase
MVQTELQSPGTIYVEGVTAERPDIKRVIDMLLHQNKHFPKTDYLAAKVDGAWVTYSTERTIELAWSIGKALLTAGVQPGDRVGIISANRPEWVLSDYGCQAIGAVSVPLYPTITADDYRFIFQDSDVRLIFVSNEEIYSKAKEACASMANPPKIVTFEDIDGAVHLDEFIQTGANRGSSEIDGLLAKVQSADLYTIIYTSGTTGTPKGVMLTHGNMICNVLASVEHMPVDQYGRALSFLPMCHVFERMVMGIYTFCGVSVYFAQSMDTIGDNLREVKPMLFTTVPRLLEKVYDRIINKGRELTGAKKTLFFWAVELGLKYEVGKPRSIWYNVQLEVARKLIFSKWREALGGNIVCIVSGAAALQPRLARIFRAAGIAVMEGYGLTETSPVITVNRHEESGSRIGTVGLLIKNVQVRIAEDGEILTKGPCLFKGYWNRPDLTDEAIDADGWFHTGDEGMIVEERFLKITDRKKEIFKTSGGKYIAPQILENKLAESMVIEQVMVVGEGERFPAALIVPQFDNLKTWCELKGVAFSTNEAAIMNPTILEKFQNEVDKMNEHLAQYEKVKKFTLLPALWTIENKEITPTLKLRRKVIVSNYKGLIDKMFV